MIDTPYYYFASAISKEDCEKIKNLGISKMPETAVTRGGSEKKNDSQVPINSRTYEELRRENENTDNYYIRDSKVSWLGERWIYDLIHPFVNEANKKAQWNYEWDCSELCQFTQYEPNGFYGWHQDASADSANTFKRYIHGVTEEYLNTNDVPNNYTRDSVYIGKTRKLSVSVNLTDPSEYKGGDLMFDFGDHTKIDRYQKCSEARQQGTVVVFPSFVYHMVEPVLEGRRYSLVMWNLGSPLK